jgi:methyl-accepting chemotaxis protein
MIKISYASRLAFYAAMVLMAAVISTSGIIAYTASNALRQGVERNLDTGLSTLRDLIAARSRSGTWTKRADGLYAGDVRLNDDTEIVDAVRRAIGGSATIFADDMRIATSIQKQDGSRATGTALSAGPVSKMVLQDGQIYRGEAQILGQPYLTIYEPIRDAQQNVIGILYVGIPESSVIALTDHLTREIAIAAVLATLIGGAIMYAVLRGSIRPLTGLIGVMTRLREGDLNVAVPLTTRHDTLGDMARSIARFQTALVEQEGLRADAQAQIVRTAEERREASLTLAQNIETRIGAVVSTLQNAASDMSRSAITASEIGNAAEQKASSATESSRATAANVQVVASASEEMAASIAEVGDRTLRSATATRAAAEAMASVEQTMTTLSEATLEIGGVVGTINEIASQTNLLALNATIEAARAGAAGKGFSVVATEVKDLARRSKSASETVGRQLDQMRATVATAVATMEQTVRNVRSIDEDMNAIAATVEQQRAATSEISRSVAFTATGMQDVADGLTAMHDDVTQTATVIRGTEVLAREVTGQGQALQAAMHEIVAHLRAA